MDKFEEIMKEAAQTMKEVEVMLKQVSKDLSTIENMFAMAPFSEFAYQVKDGYFFKWKEKRVQFGDANLVKPFIEHKASVRVEYSMYLPDFAKAMVEEIKLYIPKTK